MWHGLRAVLNQDRSTTTTAGGVFSHTIHALREVCLQLGLDRLQPLLLLFSKLPVIFAPPVQGVFGFFTQYSALFFVQLGPFGDLQFFLRF